MALPEGLSALAVRAARLLPDALLARVLPARLRFRTAVDVPEPRPSDASVRLFVGPVNFAGQGWQWARAAEHGLSGVSAVAMAYSAGTGYRFPIDDDVPASTYLLSRSWQRRQRAIVSDRFTHVIVEAGRHLFGDVYRETVAHEIRALQEAGLRVAMLSHGSDMRSPERHAATHRHSPFAGDESPRIAQLTAESERNHALHREVQTPIFVSTPGMLADVPTATWLPVVVDVEQWRSETAAIGPVPTVVHAPSSPWIKGTALIEPALRRLAAEGVIRYERLEGVPAAEMPARIRRADVVLDQFRLGDYGVAACEAMAAGRLVLGDVDDTVREFVRDETGEELPIVQADPDTLESVLREVVADSAQHRAIAAAGPGFVSAVHDGRRSAAALSSFLGARVVTQGGE